MRKSQNQQIYSKDSNYSLNY